MTFEVKIKFAMSPDHMPREGVNGFSLKQDPPALVENPVSEQHHSYQVLVFEPSLTHSIWKDWGSDECLTEAEILDLLREGVESV